MADFDHHFRFNPGDYVADTLHLTTLQHGMYWLLIIHCFKRGSLPDDPKQLMTITRVSAWHWRKHSAAVLALFQHDEKNLQYVHKRISKLIKQNMAAIGQKFDDSRAREPETKNQEESPRTPRKRGARGRARKSNGGMKNGFAESAAHDMQETVDAKTDDAHRKGAVVVPIPRRSNGG